MKPISEERRDETTLGRLLLVLGLLTPAELNHALEQAAKHPRSLGSQLLAMGKLDQQQLDGVLDLQHKLRNGTKHEMAVAQAELAMRSTASTAQLAQHIKSLSAELRRETTGSGHPAVGASEKEPT